MWSQQVNEPATHARLVPVVVAVSVVTAVAVMITNLIVPLVGLKTRRRVVVVMIAWAMVGVWVSHLAQDARPAGRGTR